MSESSKVFSGAETARTLGISPQLLSKWKRDELLRPSLGDKRNRRTQGREMRGYTLIDVVAGLFAQSAIHDLHFKGDALREMVAAVQRADEDELAHAVILTSTTRPGLMRHAWICDVRLPLINGPELFDLEEGTTGEEAISQLKEDGRYINSATMKELVEAICKVIEKKLQQDAMLASKNEAC